MRSQPEDFISTAPVEDVVSAIESFDLDATWEDVAPSLLLTMPRRRPMPAGTDDLPTRTFPPGIQVGLGLDIGPALLFVSQGQLDGWQVREEDAFDRALHNVSRRVQALESFAVLRERIAGVRTMAFQSREGWASTLLLLPEALSSVFEQDNGLILAPMRDLLLMMPLDSDKRLAHVLLEEFAAADANALDLPLFSLVDGTLNLAILGPIGPRGSPMH